MLDAGRFWHLSYIYQSKKFISLIPFLVEFPISMGEWERDLPSVGDQDRRGLSSSFSIEIIKFSKERIA